MIGLALALTSAAPALGSSAAVEDGRLVVRGALGEGNSIAVGDTLPSGGPAGYFDVHDRSIVAPGPGCEVHEDPPPFRERETRCTSEGVAGVRIELADDGGDVYAPVQVPVVIAGGAGRDGMFVPRAGLADGAGGDDSFSLLRDPVSAEVRGGPGDDALNLPEVDTAGWTVSLRAGTVVDAERRTRDMPISGIESVSGTNGVDAIEGSDADNHLAGGTGGDTISGLAGNDNISGIDLSPIPTHSGTGNYEHRRDVISCGAGRDVVHADVVDGFDADCERVVVNDFRGDRPTVVVLNGDGRPNRLRGDAGSRNRIYGRGGADRITDGPMRDTIFAGAGADSIRAAGDGKRDLIVCGTGRDTVVAGRNDSIGTDCERVKLRRR
jgi:Ca2+-binding RTX toxin-like protein